MTASASLCSSSSTPAARIRSPPMPTRGRSGMRRLSSSATGAACRSAEVSPATNRISRTAGTGRGTATRKRGQCPLDLGHDAQRHRERLTAILSGHDDVSLPSYSVDEAQELEAQRLSFGRLERHALDERLQRERGLRQLREVEILAHPVELSPTGREIQREVSAALKDPDLAHAVTRHTAGRDVRDGPGVEGDARARDIDGGRQHRHADRREIDHVPPDKRADQVDVVDHQVENDRDVGSAWIEWSKAVALDEARLADERKRGSNRL